MWERVVVMEKVMGKPQEGWNSICNVPGVMQITQMVIFTLFQQKPDVASWV